MVHFHFFIDILLRTKRFAALISQTGRGGQRRRASGTADYNEGYEVRRDTPRGTSLRGGRRGNHGARPPGRPPRLRGRPAPVPARGRGGSPARVSRPVPPDPRVPGGGHARLPQCPVRPVVPAHGGQARRGGVAGESGHRHAGARPAPPRLSRPTPFSRL